MDHEFSVFYVADPLVSFAGMLGILFMVLLAAGEWTPKKASSTKRFPQITTRSSALDNPHGDETAPWVPILSVYNFPPINSRWPKTWKELNR